MGLRSDTHRCRALVYGVERSSYQSTCGTQGGKGDPHHFAIFICGPDAAETQHTLAPRDPRDTAPLNVLTYLLTYLQKDPHDGQTGTYTSTKSARRRKPGTRV